jgi:protocatechuate 3,4-dioxygenase, alpha subunit
MTPPLTPSQTVGPFFAIGLSANVGAHVVPEGSSGSFRLSGQVFDGDGHPVPDALIETWQPEGVGRSATDDEGHFSFLTVKPLRRAGATHAPHIEVSVFARGLLTRLITRVYFPEEVAANAADPVLRSLAAEERDTLIAVSDGGGVRFDIHLQGGHETVFFDR